jgi:hypothetical protein
MLEELGILTRLGTLGRLGFLGMSGKVGRFADWHSLEGFEGSE